MNIKYQLYKICQEFVQNKLDTIEQTIQSNRSALSSETKSSAGDKHETGRAMLQLEMEKAGQQLKVVNEMMQQLDRIDLNLISEKVCLGSIVKTSTVNYFIAISIGKIEIENKLFYAISIHSPIGKKLLGKSVNEEIWFNDTKIRIGEVQ